jgi:hypothetical protein
MPLRLLRIGQARLDRTEQSDYLDLSRGPAVIVKGERSVSRQKLNNTESEGVYETDRKSAISRLLNCEGNHWRIS